MVPAIGWVNAMGWPSSGSRMCFCDGCSRNCGTTGYMFAVDDAHTGKYCRWFRPAVWNVCCGVVGCGCSLARCWVLRQHAVLFLVWCLRTVEWMRASLWSSC